MTIREFIEKYKSSKVQNSKANPNAVSEYLRKELEIKTYIPFKTKRQIAEMIVAQYTKEVDGIKKHDSISAYVGFVAASIAVHTNLQFGEDPIEDYDLLAESGLLPQIIAGFQESYNETDILLKMALASELEDNNINVSVGHVLNKVSNALDVISNKIKDLNLETLLGSDVKKENLAKLNSFLNIIK
jgi:hypothetical protein